MYEVLRDKPAEGFQLPGVSLFQGRFIDQVLAEAKRIGPAAGRGPIIKTGAIGASK